MPRSTGPLASAITTPVAGSSVWASITSSDGRTARRRARAGRLLVGLLLWAGAQGAAPATPYFLSPADGPITELLLAAPDDTPVHTQALVGVARLFGSQVRYRMVAPSATFAAVADALRGVGARDLMHIPAQSRTTPWVRDALVVVHTAAGPAWAPAAALRRAGDAGIAAWAAGVDPQLTLGAALPVVGGNLVALGAHAFVGGRAGRLTPALPGVDWHRVTSPGPPVQGPWAGRGQPLYHLDLYFAAAGAPAAPVLLVGAVPSPSAGPASRVQDEDGLRAALDAVAAELVREGFAVRRVPVLRIQDPDDGAPLLVTYTNVLLDERNGQPLAYLPRYGAVLPELVELDGEAAAVYHDLGYAVIWYEGPLRAMARAGAGLRCLVLETARGSRKTSSRGKLGGGQSSGSSTPPRARTQIIATPAA